jgi:hypothetical protein
VWNFPEQCIDIWEAGIRFANNMQCSVAISRCSPLMILNTVEANMRKLIAAAPAASEYGISNTQSLIAFSLM